MVSSEDFVEDELLNDVKDNNELVKVHLVPFIKEEEVDDAEALSDVKANNELVKLPLLPLIKEEEMDDAELERMVEDVYGRDDGFVRYAKDGYDDREAADLDEYPPLLRDPTLWKVKCMVGLEKHSVFCLMQKHVNLQTPGTNLQNISAFSLDHVNGFIYVEADSQQDLYEACRGLFTIYVSRVTPIPPNKRSHVLSVRSTGCRITAGMWARVMSGKYKGDLGQIVVVNKDQKEATVKLKPRIDLQGLAEKNEGGVSAKRSSTPTPPGLISSREVEKCRPLIEMQGDCDTNTTFKVLDGMMLKDGYLYKKIPIDPLSVWGAMPTEDELLKFEPANNNESMNLGFLSDVIGNGNRKKKHIMKNDKGVKKTKGSSTVNVEFRFEVHDLVFLGKEDFGVIIGMEKDDNFKIMKGGTEGPLVLTLPAQDLKSSSFEQKLFTAQDLHMKKISIGDTVRVMDGPLKDKEGVVKHIYRGIIFLFNESEEEHNGYTCFKSQICEKVISEGQAYTDVSNDQNFLLHFIMGTYFGPHLKEEPHMSVFQRRAKRLPPYTSDELAGSHIRTAEIERIYNYVLRKADPSVVIKHRPLHQFLLGVVRSCEGNPGCPYLQFGALFPPRLHPLSWFDDQYDIISNIVFINEPETYYIHPVVIKKFKKMTRLEHLHLDRQAGELASPSSQNSEANTLPASGHKSTAPSAPPSPAKKATTGRKDKEEFDINRLKRLKDSTSQTAPALPPQAATKRKLKVVIDRNRWKRLKDSTTSQTAPALPPPPVLSSPLVAEGTVPSPPLSLPSDDRDPTIEPPEDISTRTSPPLITDQSEIRNENYHGVDLLVNSIFHKEVEKGNSLGGSMDAYQRFAYHFAKARNLSFNLALKLQETDTAIQEKNLAIREKELALLEKDKATQERNTAIQEKDLATQEGHNLKIQLCQHNETIQALQSANAILTSQVIDLQNSFDTQINNYYLSEEFYQDLAEVYDSFLDDFASSLVDVLPDIRDRKKLFVEQEFKL